MLLDFGIDQFTPKRFEPRERPFLVGTHEPVVPGDFGGENGGQPALDVFRGQDRMGRMDYRLSGCILTVKATAAIPFR